jgi:hypothetical protein
MTHQKKRSHARQQEKQKAGEEFAPAPIHCVKNGEPPLWCQSLSPMRSTASGHAKRFVLHFNDKTRSAISG